MKNIFIHGFGHGDDIGIKLYGYINRGGNIILEPLYYELSDFNDEGYAFGIKIIKRQNRYENELIKDYEKYDYTYNFIGKGVYHKIDKYGNLEEITKEEYYQNYDIEPNKKDENIMLKKNVERIVDIKHIFLESIFPLIIALLSIIIIKKTIKKEEKNDSTNIK